MQPFQQHERLLSAVYATEAIGALGELNLSPSFSLTKEQKEKIQGIRDTAKQARDKARAALQLVGMSHRESHLPRMLSGGEQQRVAVARALVIEPALVLADEPTGNLDSASGLEVMAVLRELNATGRTIVLITHDSDVASEASRQIHLHDGRIAA